MDGTFTSFDVSSACATSARAINARGEIAGRYRHCSASRTSHGFFRAADGTITTFDVPSAFGADSTAAYGINDLDEIVGAYTVSTLIGTTTVDVTRGFLLKADGTFTKIDFPDAAATIAAAIDNQEDIVGGYFLLSTDPISVGVHGFLKTSQGAFSTIDVPFTGAVVTFLVGINEPGDIVGDARCPPRDLTQPACWKRRGLGNMG